MNGCFVRPGIPVLLAVLVWSTLACSNWPPLPAAEPTFLTDRAFQKQLETPVGVLWSERELRGALSSLSRSQNVAILLDRRIDPSQLVVFQAQNLALRDLLERFAHAHQAGVAVVNWVVYVGPRDTARRLPTVAKLRADEIRRLPKPLRDELEKRAAVTWPELATPRELIEGLARATGLTVENPDVVPHDLWPEISLPPVGRSEQLTLILAGFDFTFQISAARKQLRIVPIPKDLAVLPEAPRRGSPGTAREGLKLYDLTIKDKPVLTVLRGLAKQLGLALVVEPAAEPRLERQVTFEVTKASLEQLLDATTRPAGLRAQVVGGELRVSIAP